MGASSLESRQIAIECIDAWRREMRYTGNVISHQHVQALLDRLSSVPGNASLAGVITVLAKDYERLHNVPTCEVRGGRLLNGCDGSCSRHHVPALQHTT